MISSGQDEVKNLRYRELLNKVISDENSKVYDNDKSVNDSKQAFLPQLNLNDTPIYVEPSPRALMTPSYAANSQNSMAGTPKVGGTGENHLIPSAR